MTMRSAGHSWAALTIAAAGAPVCTNCSVEAGRASRVWNPHSCTHINSRSKPPYKADIRIGGAERRCSFSLKCHPVGKLPSTPIWNYGAKINDPGAARSTLLAAYDIPIMMGLSWSRVFMARCLIGRCQSQHLLYRIAPSPCCYATLSDGAVWRDIGP